MDVDLPDDEAVPQLVRSFAACLASVLETPVDVVPQPRADLQGAIAHWRSWLAGRDAGLVSHREARALQLARVLAGSAGRAQARVGRTDDAGQRC